LRQEGIDHAKVAEMSGDEKYVALTQKSPRRGRRVVEWKREWCERGGGG
jgi:hypothetical protein